MNILRNLSILLIVLLTGCGISRGPARLSSVSLSYDRPFNSGIKQFNYWLTFEIFYQPDPQKVFTPDWKKIIEFWNINMENKDLEYRK